MGVRDWESCSSPNNLNGNMIVAALALPQLQASSHPNATQAVDSGLNSHDSLATPQHPLGIKPAGNVYLADANIKGSAGYFATLPDELIVQVLEFLDAVALRQLQHTCKALFAFTRLEDLWKIICVEYVGTFQSQIRQFSVNLVHTFWPYSTPLLSFVLLNDMSHEGGQRLVSARICILERSTIILSSLHLTYRAPIFSIAPLN